MHVSADPKYWDEVNVKFFTKYAGIDACHQRWKDAVMHHGVIHGPLGRSWSIGMKRDKRGELKIPWTVLSNYPVQGTGADVMMLARLMAHKRIKKANIECKFISTVHDSIVLDAPQKSIEPLAELFHGVFQDIPKVIKQNFGYDWIVPMACECKWGKNMKDMEKMS
jgi:DNA polymerase I-like protein with 3'-5' exonuclease and polymerase domains